MKKINWDDSYKEDEFGKVFVISEEKYLNIKKYFKFMENDLLKCKKAFKKINYQAETWKNVDEGRACENIEAIILDLASKLSQIRYRSTKTKVL